MSARSCEVNGCDRKHYAKGICSVHYQRIWATGSAELQGRTKTLSQRFWEKVSKSEGCWEWKAARHYKGYGQFHVKGRGMVKAHRVAYEISIGPIPEGMQIDHACLNKGCVRPDHLRLATPKQNCENLSENRVNNTSGVRGVSWNKRTSKWSASLSHNRQAFHLGYYEDKAEAEAAVLSKRLELFTHNELDRKAA